MKTMMVLIASLMSASTFAGGSISAFNEGVDRNVDIRGLRVEAPSEFDEGTEVIITSDQMSEIKEWAKNSKFTLEEMLRQIKRTGSAMRVKEILVNGIKNTVLASMPKRTEILMRYILNRSLKVVEELENYVGQTSPGLPVTSNQHILIAQQVRIMHLSIEMALRYYQDDLDFLDGKAKKEGKSLANLPFAKFGVEYVQFLMGVNESILHAKAQYKIAMWALGLFQVDLYRSEQERTLYAPAIKVLNDFINTSPSMANASDPELIERLRLVRETYFNTLNILKTLMKDIKIAQLPAPQSNMDFVDVGRHFKSGTRFITTDRQQIGEIIAVFPENRTANVEFSGLGKYNVPLNKMAARIKGNCYEDYVCEGWKMANSSGQIGTVKEVFENGWVRIEFSPRDADVYVKYYYKDLFKPAD